MTGDSSPLAEHVGRAGSRPMDEWSPRSTFCEMTRSQVVCLVLKGENVRSWLLHRLHRLQRRIELDEAGEPTIAVPGGDHTVSVNVAIRMATKSAVPCFKRNRNRCIRIPQLVNCNQRTTQLTDIGTLGPIRELLETCPDVWAGVCLLASFIHARRNSSCQISVYEPWR